MDRLISALKNFTPTRKEHILRTCLITIVLAYSTFFYGAWYGINKSAGYAIRYYFAEISTILRFRHLVLPADLGHDLSSIKSKKSLP